MSSMTRARLALAVAVASAGFVASAAGAEYSPPVSGAWTGTIELTTEGTRVHKVGYTGDPVPPRVSGQSNQKLQWRIRLTGSDTTFTDDGTGQVPNPYSDAVLEYFAWSALGVSEGATSEGASCAFSSTSTMEVPVGLPGRFTGFGGAGFAEPKFNLFDLVAGQLSIAASPGCTSGVILGFQTAPFLHDVLVFREQAGLGTPWPEFALCPGASPWLLPGFLPDAARGPAGVSRAGNRWTIKTAATVPCVGSYDRWFGDSTLTVDNDFQVSYKLDLAFTPTGESDVPVGACNDGKSNDFDGLVDWPLDPGCADGLDASEYGGAQCDNGIDDQGDGRTDWPADPTCSSASDTVEAQPSCDGGDFGFSSRDYRAYVNLPRDLDLFTFTPSVRYRFTDTCAEILQGNAHGNTQDSVRLGTYILALLGFEFRVDELNHRFDTDVPAVSLGGGHDAANPPTADIEGDFDVQFDWSKLLLKVKLPRALRDSKAMKRLEKPIQEHIDRLFAGGRVTSIKARGKLARRWVGPLQAGISNVLERALDKALKGPDRIMNPIKKKVLELAQRDLDNLEVPIKLTKRRNAGRNLIKRYIENTLSRLAGVANHRFSVWSPDVLVTVRPGGKVEYELKGYKNPFLSTEVAGE